MFVQQGFEVKNIKAFHRETGRVQTTGLESNTVYDQEQGGFTTTKFNTQEPPRKKYKKTLLLRPQVEFLTALHPIIKQSSASLATTTKPTINMQPTAKTNFNAYCIVM